MQVLQDIVEHHQIKGALREGEGARLGEPEINAQLGRKGQDFFAMARLGMPFVPQIIVAGTLKSQALKNRGFVARPAAKIQDPGLRL